MDHIGKNLQDQYFGASRTASASISSYIEEGMIVIARGIAKDLEMEFGSDALRVNDPTVSGRLHVAFDAEVGWLPDPTKKGGMLVSLGFDQFDLNKSELYFKIWVPSGKTYQKTFDGGSGLVDRPLAVNAKRLGDFLKSQINGFFLSLEG